MLTSLAFLFLAGLALGQLCVRLHLPALVGYIAAGILLGPDLLGALRPEFLALSPHLRRFALIVILLRAGLALHPADLRRAGRPALLLCFVPACFEIVGCILLAPPLLGLTHLEAALLGAVIAAVSPAVVVPRMLHLIDRSLGTRHAIPQMILTGASADDVFVLVVFSWLCAQLSGGDFSPLALARVPLSIVLGCAAGLLLGRLFSAFFHRFPLRDTAKLLALLSLCFLLMAAEDKSPIPFSGMLGVMTLGATTLSRSPALAEAMAAKLSRVWVWAELILFALVGAAVRLPYVRAAGMAAIALTLGALCFRMAGVLVSTLGTHLTARERLFSMLAYCPKATVQAAIGGVPLAMGLASGHTILTVAVVSILLTAPFGALAIDHFAEKLLSQA